MGIPNPTGRSFVIFPVTLNAGLLHTQTHTHTHLTTAVPLVKEPLKVLLVMAVGSAVALLNFTH